MAVSGRLPGSLQRYVFDRNALTRRERVEGKLTLWGSYVQQRRDAKGRKIEFLLTFDQWLDIWEASGKLYKRGPKIGQYVMARFNDVGPYGTDNVEIISASQNHKDGNIGKPRPKSLEHRRKLGDAARGRKLSAAHKKKIGDGVRGKLKGIAKTPAHKQALRVSALRRNAELRGEL